LWHGILSNGLQMTSSLFPYGYNITIRIYFR
jgi:hypothetical protein